MTEKEKENKMPEEEQQPDEIDMEESVADQFNLDETEFESDEIESTSGGPLLKKTSRISSANFSEGTESKSSSSRIELKGVERRRRQSPRILIPFGAIVLVGLIFAAGYFLGTKKFSIFSFGKSRALKQVSTKKSQKKKQKKKEEAAIKVDKAAIKIDVLNGNGIKGEAAAVASVLKQSGFNVQNAINADNPNYSQTLLRYKIGYENAAKLVAKEISPFYPAMLQQDLKEDSKSDIVLVLGKDKKTQSSKSSVGIRILNGNGKKGSAQEVAEILKKNGFQVKETKNADKFDYPETIISYKPGKKDIAQQITKQIASKYSANLKEDASLDVDIVILLGQK